MTIYCAIASCTSRPASWARSFRLRNRGFLPELQAHMDVQTVNELLAGSVGGAAQVLVGQPLDTIKTRAQIAPSSVLLLAFTREEI